METAKRTGATTMACNPPGKITPVHDRCKGWVTNAGPCACECHRSKAPELGPKR